jgi:hypothetical protein
MKAIKDSAKTPAQPQSWRQMRIPCANIRSSSQAAAERVRSGIAVRLRIAARNRWPLTASLADVETIWCCSARNHIGRSRGLSARAC